jgi:hypothetical protein
MNTELGFHLHRKSRAPLGRGVFLFFALLLPVFFALSCDHSPIWTWYEEDDPKDTSSDAGPSESCEIVLYCFLNPAGIGVTGQGSGSAKDPVTISIVYPNGTSVPVSDGDIKIVHTGASAEADGPWAGGDGVFTRSYTVTAESGAEKHYRVTASEAERTGQTVTVEPGMAVVARKGTQVFTASGGDPWEWSVYGSEPEGTSVIDADGTLSVGEGETATRLLVAAMSPVDRFIIGVAAVHIPTVVEVKVAASEAGVVKGKTLRCYAVVAGIALGEEDEGVNWSVTDVSGGAVAGATIDGGLLSVSATVTAETLRVTATSAFDGTKKDTVAIAVLEQEVAAPEADPPDPGSIKVKLGITTTGKLGVMTVFYALHAYIENGGLESEDNVIQLGDWIDLEEGLTVAAYGEGIGTGGFSVENTAITAQPFTGYKGRRLRLIVVGINSFQSERGVKDDVGTPTFNGENGGKYTETVNDGVPHVVFQFQNLPVRRRMEATDTNANGYLGSEMRAYLVNNFLAGLIEAGVPGSVLWAPARSVANKGYGATGADPISDPLWLPTERELFGSGTLSVAAYETAANQARLEYYTDNSKRVKYYNGSNTRYAWWEASPCYTAGASSFCLVSSNVIPSTALAGSVGGCAPAFCVR